VTSSALLLIHAYNSSGAWLGQLSSGSVTGNTDWANLSVVLNGNAPAGTAYVRVGVQMTQGSGTAYFDNIRLLEGEQRTTLGYNTAGNYVMSVKDPLGNTVSMTVDANTGNVTTVAKPLGSALTYTYDWLNRLTGTSYTYQSVNKTYTYGYDLNSNLTSVTDPNGAAPWSFSYNALNQITSASELVSGVSRTTTMIYDALGNLTKASSPNGAYMQLTYDNANRPTKTEYGTGTNPPTDTFNFGYDATGNLTSFGPSGSTTTLAYDPLDQLTTVTKPFTDGNHTLSNTYDSAGNRTAVSMTTPSLSWSANYAYDSRSAVSKVTENRFGKNSWYLQNEAGQVVKSYSEATSGGFSSFYKYDAAGRVTEVLVQNSTGQVTTLLRYTYNQNGNVTRVDDDLAGKWVLFTYDELDQLTKEEYWTSGYGSAGTTIQYAYDALGNRTSVTNNGVGTTYSYNTEKNRLTAVGGASYQYDAAGNLISDGAKTYTWDNANQLKQVQAGANTYSFTYDALGRRVSKTVNGTAEYYHYDGDKVAYVTNSSGAILQIFTYDGGGRPLYLHQNGTLYQYHYNGHGDVIKLTDMNQAVVAEYKYDAWGNITSETGTLAGSNPYRYAGYWYDKETGLYYLNARYYKPDVGRFISQDSYGGQKKAPLTLNRYAYGLNNPVNFVDPTGKSSIAATLVGGGLFAGIGSAIAMITAPVSVPLVLIGGAIGLATWALFGDVIEDIVFQDSSSTGEPSPEVVRPSPEGGRIIVDPDGNALIEPSGGTTVGTPDGSWIETQHPNGSPAQQKHQPHKGPKGWKTPHGHEFEPGPGPNQRGPSLNPQGQRVSPKSPEAHWDIKFGFLRPPQ
jgi:RHS repeat-associated protein